MKRVVLGVLVAVFMSLAFAPDADARLFRRRSRGGSSSSTGSHMMYTPTKFSTEKRLYGKRFSLQEVAMLRAQWMAHKQTLDDGIHDYTPDCPTWAGHGATGEGIGCSADSNYKNCSTCIVGNTVVADGWCKAKNGMIYRVRLFR